MGETLTDGASVILGGWIRIYTDRILVGLGNFIGRVEAYRKKIG